MLWLGTYVYLGNLAPLPKKPAGSTGKSGVGLMGKSIAGKSGGVSSSSNKASFGSNSNKATYFGSSASKASNFGSTPSKTSNFGSTASKTSTFGATASKASPLVVSPEKDKSSLRTPSFFSATGTGKVSSGLLPSTSRDTYNVLSTPKNAKSSTTFGIIWLPGRKRNKKKELVYSSINYDKKKERTPTMYNIMSGDSPDYQIHKKKDEESGLLEKVKGPIATAASAGAVTIITDGPSDLTVADPEEKLLKHDQEESKDAAGDANNKKDAVDMENNDLSKQIPESKYDKSSDKVDSVYISPTSGLKSPPPQSTTSHSNEDDCLINCLYYTLQCCDCVLM